LLLKNPKKLLRNSEDWLLWSLYLRRHPGHRQVDEDGQESGEQGSERVVHTSVLVNFDNLVDDPSHQVDPRKGGGK